jgi:glycosyltransferase involved in cell wall biosynthesis
MRKIAIITTQAFSLVNFRGPLIRTLSEKGIKVYALAPDFDELLRTQVVELGAEPVDYVLSRIAMNPMLDAFAVFRLSYLLNRLSPEMTLAYFIKPVIYGSIASWLARVPKRFSIVEGLGYVFGDDSISQTWQRSLLRYAISGFYRFALRLNNRVFFLNKEDISLFVKEEIVADEKVVWIDGIGLDLDHFRPVPSVVGTVTFILVARMLREKGVYDFVEAARQVRAQYPTARFLLVGGGDKNPGSVPETKLREWALEGLLEWTGQVADVRQYLMRSSVFVYPSYYREGLPRSTQEAMAMGLPVITTDWVGCRDTVEDGVNGFLVPIRDPEALAKTMTRFIENPELIAKMGQAGRRIAEERFDVHIINRQIIDTLSKQ